MRFEGAERTPNEDEAQFERVPADSMESLSGPLAEGFRMCFDTKQMKDFVRDVFERNNLDLLLVQHIPDEDVSEVIKISAGYFDLSDDAQRARAEEIAQRIASIAQSRMEAEGKFE